MKKIVREKERIPIRKGIGFGLTSGIITTLGLMVGLYSGTHLRLAVIGGILVIAIADALSDALGMHISEEAENEHSTKEIWRATIYTFFAKLIFASTFIIPVMLLPLSTAVIVSVVYGMILLGIFSFIMAKRQGARPWKVILEHVLIAIVVVIATHYLGNWIRLTFS